MTYSEKVLNDLKIKNPDQPEFIQAATEVLEALAPVVDNDPVYAKTGLLFLFVVGFCYFMLSLYCFVYIWVVDV